jgi:hypothetical protein
MMSGYSLLTASRVSKLSVPDKGSPGPATPATLIPGHKERAVSITPKASKGVRTPRALPGISTLSVKPLEQNLQKMLQLPATGR